MASIPTRLPSPDADALLRSQQLAQIIQQKIQKYNGWISFAEFMHMALYTPSLGYYTGGAKKFGDTLNGGDFVTAPQISPLFAKTLARQAAQVLQTLQTENQTLAQEKQALHTEVGEHRKRFTEGLKSVAEQGGHAHTAEAGKEAAAQAETTR